MITCKLEILGLVSKLRRVDSVILIVTIIIIINHYDQVNVRIAHLRIAHWGAILRWAILSPSVIRIAHPNF